MSKKSLGIVIWSIIGLAIISFITVFAVMNSNSGEDANVSSGVVNVPTTVNEFGAFRVTADGIGTNTNKDLPGLYIYLDPLCPGCGYMERTLGETFNELVENGDMALYVTPLAFLDQASTDDYSSRVVSAAVTIAEESPEHFLAFINATFNNQPEENPNYVSVSNDDLVALAKGVGVPSEIAETIKEEKFKAWAIENTNEVNTQKDVFPKGLSTPSLFVNLRDADGKVINNTPLDFDTELPLDTYIKEMVVAGK